MSTGLTANAVLVTGDPSADGWAFSSNTLDNGNYIEGTSNFGYNLYSASFLADSTLAGNAGGGWLNGHSILAIGGKRQSTDGFTAGWGSAFTGIPVNGDLTSSVRIVAKFGTTVSNEVTVSTVKPAAGNGFGSFSGGDLGDGSILLGTPNSGGLSGLGGQNAFLTFSTNQRAVGTGTPVVSNINADVGRLIYTLDGTGLLTWEVLLNTSLLPVGISPSAGANSVLTLQRGAGNVTNTLVSIAAVPEPGAILFGGLAVCIAAATFFSKRLKEIWASRR
jgi:hypothetical protein